MASDDPGMEAVVVQSAADLNRAASVSPAVANAEDTLSPVSEEKTESENNDSDNTVTDGSDTVYARSAVSSPKSGIVDVDTNKVHVDASSLEARPMGHGPEVVRHSIGLEPISNLEILNAAQQPPPWLNKKRFYMLICGIITLLIVAILVIGLVAGLVLTRRNNDSSSSTPSPTPNAPAASSLVCGTEGAPIIPVNRTLLAAAAINSTVYVFARGMDDDIWYRPLDGAEESAMQWEEWVPGVKEKFAGPPTALYWEPRGNQRLNVFAPKKNKYSVLTAGFKGGLWPTSWQNLGEESGTPVALCLIPPGMTSAAADAPERIDQWVVNKNSRGIFHNFWNAAIDDFQEPATYKDWEASPSVQPSASMLQAICRKNDPVHTLLMYANGTNSIRFRHYTGENRVWNSWVDIGGEFIGDPIIIPINETYFWFFGVSTDGQFGTFNWTSATGVGYRPAPVNLKGNFSSMPSAIITNMDDPARPWIDVVGLSVGGRIMHNWYNGTHWQDWENLGISTVTAPFLFTYQGERNKTLLAAIGAENKLYYTTWETSTKKAWPELAKNWKDGGGNLTLKSMCD